MKDLDSQDLYVLGEMSSEEEVICSPTKRPRRPLSSREKESIITIFTEKYEELKHKTAAVNKVAEIFKLSDRHIYNILEEKKKSGTVTSPKKSPGRPSKLANLDDNDKEAIRRKLHGFFFANEIPTLDKLLKAINDDDSLPKMSRSSLYKLLRELGIRYLKRSRKSILIDKEEIIIWRRKYLREIRRFRQEGKSIYYLDETWVNEGHTKSTVWQDTTVSTSRQAFVEGLSTGLKNPSGKGKRLIIVHIGSEKGFLEEGLLMFESKKTGDYHEEMNSEMFEDWFGKIIAKVDKNSVIVMDNAPYHSRKAEKIPTSSVTKHAVKTWLESKGIEYEDDMLKAELLELVRRNKTKYDSYVIDEMAKAAGHQILRLPPYHCEFNPIELIWAQVKEFVASNNKTYKLKDVKELLLTSISKIDLEKWKSCIEHVQNTIEPKYWEVNKIIEEHVEKFIINLEEDSSSDSDF